MTDMASYKPGTFCWAELGTSDAAAAKKFYGALFDWQPRDVAGDVPYTLLQIGEKDICGLYALMPDQKKAGVPPHWLSYVSVESADAAAKKAQSLGAKLFMGPMDVMDIGRMAVLQDTTGAAFAVWQPRTHIGSAKRNEPGAPCWNELMTTNVKAARTFYTGLFGWGTEDMDMGQGEPYTLFKVGAENRGGSMQMPAEWKGVPSHWLVYFAVADCDATCEKARGLRAEVLVPPTDIPDVGRFAILQDPQRAVFAVIKLMPA